MVALSLAARLAPVLLIIAPQLLTLPKRLLTLPKRSASLLLNQRRQDSNRADAVRELHKKLRVTLDRPVDLWGVRVASRGSIGTEESALLSSFLRARDWDVDHALHMFTSHVAWRREFGVDKLSAKEFAGLPCENLFNDRDSKGRLIVMLRLGDLDGESFEDMERFLRWRIYTQERLNAQLDFHRGEPAYTLVLNCDGWGMGHFGKPARQSAKELSRVCQDYYPDYLGQILVCCPPPIFAFAYGLLRPFLPRNFVKLIKVHNGDEESCLTREAGVRPSRARAARRAASARERRPELHSLP